MSVSAFHLFIDNNQHILRVGGRLQNSELPQDAVHHIIVSPTSHLTALIICSQHQRLLHAGTQLLFSADRERFWVPRLRQWVRSLNYKCLQFFKLKAAITEELVVNILAHKVCPAKSISRMSNDPQWFVISYSWSLPCWSSIHNFTSSWHERDSWK